MSDPWAGYEPPASLLQSLADVVGIVEFDRDDILHRKLLTSLAELGPGATTGDRISACRFVIAWELRDAAHRSKTGKANYEQAVSMRVLALTEEARVKGRRIGEGLAKRQAETENFDDRMTYLQQEARATSMRQLLGALEGSLDNFRTLQANERAADRAHAQGHGSHS